MSEDKFDYLRPEVSFSCDELHVLGEEGTKVQDHFMIYSTNEVPMRGVVYSSNPYVRLIRPQFSGTEAKISFEILGQNYKQGDHLTGYFTIVCNPGEYRLAFAVQFEAKKLLCSSGTIETIQDFAVLAQGHWNEAVQLFYSSAFETFIERQDIDLRLLYQGYRKALPSSVNLEEFLVAAGQKEAITYWVAEERREFYEVRENRKETIEITKNTWGYVELQITSDQDFVTVEKDVVNADYFLGSTMSLNFYIHKEHMHAGKNYARITITGKGAERVVEIMATADREDYQKIWIHRPKKQLLSEVTGLYEAYRFHRLTTGDWCHHTLEKLDLLCRIDDIVWYRLMKAQCLILNKQRQEALWIVSDLKKEIADKSSVEWAYLLYLCTLLEQEVSYVDRLTKEIEVIFRSHPDDVRIFWFLLFLREEYYQNGARKLRAIEQWMEAGCASPFLYVEALAMYLQDPYLLREFTDPAVKILLWAVRRHALSKDLAMQIAHILPATNRFHPWIWQIAQEAYAVYPEVTLLSDMVSYLLRTQQYGEEYLPWYRMAMGEELRLSGIYEAYMMALPDYSPSALPQMLLLYFQYSCNLPDQKKALLYANVITNRDETPQLYQQYFRQMEQFAVEQMKQGHINDNLAILYQNVLQNGVIDEEIANAVAGMIYMRKIVTLHLDVTRIFLYQEQYEMPIVVPVVSHQAYLPIISKHYRLLLETKRGEMLSDPALYAMQRMLYADSYLAKLKHLSPCALPFVLHDLGQQDIVEDFQVSDIPKLEVCIRSSLMAKHYIASLYPSMVTFLQKHCREELLERHFLEEVDDSSLDVHTRSFMMALFVSQGHYERAYDMMKRYNGMEMDRRLLLNLVDERIAEASFEEDDFLTALAGSLLEQGTTSPLSVSYLSQNYIGPTKDMLCLWKKAKEIELPVPELEENLLFQALYAESHMNEMQEIFDSYLMRGRDKMLIEAYLNYWSHEYMLSREGIPEQLFTYLAYHFDRDMPMKESACLAYMKYLSSLPLLSDREWKIQDMLLNQYIRRNMYFAFYRHMDRRLIIKYQLYDKLFVEYSGKPGEHIMIRYRGEDEQLHEEDMIEMYEGIFVKQFVLFFGEKITYELYKMSDEDEQPVCTGELTMSDVLELDRQDRFHLLNQMQSAYFYGETDKLANQMKIYQGLDRVTKDLFSLV